MSQSIRTILYDEQAVGKRIKSTKKRFTWKFALDSQVYTIDLFSSKFSGKKVLKVNDEKFFEGKKQSKVFHISLEISSHAIIVIEVGKGFDLRIDGVSFDTLHKQESLHGDFAEQGTMSSKLIPDEKAEWEKLARPYDISAREGSNITTREKLPITKKPRGRTSLKQEDLDPRFLSKEHEAEQNLLVDLDPKPRSLSTQGHVNSNNPFF